MDPFQGVASFVLGWTHELPQGNRGADFYDFSGAANVLNYSFHGAGSTISKLVTFTF
jgi:hypothetical protein